jgi:transposase
MKYVGIDIGKRFHVAVSVNEQNVFSKHIKIDSLQKGYDELKKFLMSEEKQENIVIGLEATGHYWLTLFEKLKRDGYSVFVLNPLQVQSFRNEKIRGSKTDDADCELIAKVVKFGIGRETKIPDEELFQLKQLSRFRYDLVQQVTGVKLQVMKTLDIIFPEYDTIFYDMFGATSKQVLSEYTTPEVIANLEISKLTKALKKASKNQMKKQQAQLLQETAKQSFGLQYGIDAFSLELKCMIENIDHLAKQIVRVEERIKLFVKNQQTQLITIPGISHITAGVILGEMTDFNLQEQTDPRSLLAFAGLDPSLNQSGLMKGTAKMSKRGSRYLRQAIWQASLTAMTRDPMFKKIYEKQKGKGKHHSVCLSHVAKKLVYVIFSILKSGKEYHPVLTD